ncbi:MAG: hypothetical protein ACYDBH_24500 [Acidobacteriaceae bacterium]
MKQAMNSGGVRDLFAAIAECAASGKLRKVEISITPTGDDTFDVNYAVAITGELGFNTTLILQTQAEIEKAYAASGWIAPPVRPTMNYEYLIPHDALVIDDSKGAILKDALENSIPKRGSRATTKEQLMNDNAQLVSKKKDEAGFSLPRKGRKKQ